MITPVLLCGGGGSRLWPMSRTAFPKQLLPLVSDKTLLQETALRVGDQSRFKQPIVICNVEHRFLVAEQLRHLDIVPQHLILEPAGRNTAPAVATACLAHGPDDDDLLLILPADHVIENEEAFLKAVFKAEKIARQGKIITFGINPTQPETGYGYIQKGTLIEDGIYCVQKFQEKPTLELAKELVASGEYSWNSGIFLCKAKVMLEELKRLQPDLLKQTETAFNAAEKDLDFLRLDPVAFEKIQEASIDYAIMEHTPHAAVIPVDMGWSDVGSWKALWDISVKDNADNVLIGDVVIQDVSGSYIRSDQKLVSVIGLDDLIVIVHDDAVLIAKKSESQRVKEVVHQLKNNNRVELDMHSRIYRPWGYYQSVDAGERFQVKRLMLHPGAKTSTQMQHHRAEHWVVVNGTAKVTRDDEILMLHENESVYLPIGCTHSVENPGKIPLHLIEVQAGSYLGEDDIVRIDDLYGRC